MHLFVISFMSLALEDISVKILLCGISEIFLPMFSSRAFVVSLLMFKSFIHLEFIFVYGVRWCSSFIVFLCSCQNLPPPFLEMPYLHLFMFVPSFWVLIGHKDMRLFLGSLFSSIDLCLFYATTRLFWLLWPCNILWYQVLWSLLLCSSFSKLLWLFEVIYGST